MHTIPPSVLDEMLAAHAMEFFPDWNLSSFDAPTELVLGRLSEMFEQPGFESRTHQVPGGEWYTEVADLDEALTELMVRGTAGGLHFGVLHDGQIIFQERPGLTYRPKLWDHMVEYACHAARVAGARGVVIHDGSADEAEVGSMTDGDEPVHRDRATGPDN